MNMTMAELKRDIETMRSIIKHEINGIIDIITEEDLELIKKYSNRFQSEYGKIKSKTNKFNLVIIHDNIERTFGGIRKEVRMIKERNA